MTTIEIITPERAKEMLTVNICNRPVSKANLDGIVGGLKRGEWKHNHQPIIFSKEGRLLDGQHRLMACVNTGISIKVTIEWGASADIFPTLDSGKARDNADTLGLLGEKNYILLSATLKVIRLYKRNGAPGEINSPRKLTNTQIKVLLEQYPLSRRSVSYCNRSGFGSPRILATGHFIFSEIDPELAEVFFEDLFRGSNLDSDDPVFQLRERVRSTAHIEPCEQLALLIFAWNDRRRGKKIKVLRWRTKGPAPQEFPRAF